MSYDDMKEHNGKRYTGMPVGASHHWNYPNGIWNETKLTPDRWSFNFTSRKERRRAAPTDSGVPTDSQYHWYILANQIVRKLDANAYETFMHGVKFKVGHKRPHWRNFSYEYPEQLSESERVIQILEETLASLKKGDIS